MQSSILRVVSMVIEWGEASSVSSWLFSKAAGMKWDSRASRRERRVAWQAVRWKILISARAVRS